MIYDVNGKAFRNRMKAHVNYLELTRKASLNSLRECEEKQRLIKHLSSKTKKILTNELIVNGLPEDEEEIDFGKVNDLLKEAGVWIDLNTELTCGKEYAEK